MVEIAVFHYTGLTLSKKNIKLYNIICFNSLPNNPESRQRLTHSSVKYIFFFFISQVLGERFKVLCPIAIIRNSHLSLSLGDQTHNSRTIYSIPKLLSYAGTLWPNPELNSFVIDGAIFLSPYITE